MALVAARLDAGRYVVTSFRDAGCCRRSSTTRPETRTGLLVGPRGARRAARSALRRERRRRPAPARALAGTGILGWAAGHGLAVWLWTVNDDRPRCDAVARHPHVEALITDVPAHALSVFTWR